MRYSKKAQIQIGIVTAVVFFIFAAGYLSSGNSQSPISSVEVGFASLSPMGYSGGFVIPASCPSNEHSPGECSGGGGGNARDAACSNISHPPTVQAGQQFYSTVTMLNNGTAAWLAAGNCSAGAGDYFCLGSESPQNNATWGLNRVDLPVDVQPNQSYTFGFTSTAPGTAGSYSFHWRMLRENDIWFGQTCQGQVQVNQPPPTASISADSTSIFYNTGTTIRWSSTNATSCIVLPPGWMGTSGAQGTGNLTSSQTYTLNCSGPGGSASNSVTVNVGSPPTASLSANPTTINRGQSSTLTWSSTNTTSCSINQGVGGVAVNGTRSVSPNTTTTYTLSCSGPGASAPPSSATVTVNQPPGDFNLSLGGSVVCNSVPLSWTAASGATAYRILRGSPRVDISPYQPYTSLNFTDSSISQNTSYLYQIEAYNSAGTNRSNTINVTTPFCPPTLTFSGNPTTVFQGQSTTLTWSTTYTTSCTASGAWVGSRPVNGSQIVVPNPPPSSTYNLQCSGSGGSTLVQRVTINITPLGLPEWREIIPR